MMIPRTMHWPPGAKRSGGGQDGRCVQIVWTDGVKRCEQGIKTSRCTPLKVNAWDGNVAYEQALHLRESREFTRLSST